MVEAALYRFFFTKIVYCFLLVLFLCFGNIYSDIHNQENNVITSSAFENTRDHGNKNDAAKFDGEVLKYRIGFWIFKRVGIATFKCERNGDDLVATIDACTTGFLDKIIHRHNIYKTTMKIENGTNRLIPINSYEKKIKRKKERVIITNYDYENNMCEYKTWRNGLIHKKESVKLKPDRCDDTISVGYNFRNEIYGEVKEGASFNITTVYKDKSPNLSVNVRSADNSVELSKWINIIPNVKYVADVALDPEILDSKEGKLVVLYTEDLIPVGFLAKDVIGFGDLCAFLIKDTN